VSGPLVAAITGASSGIGEATARRLAREPGARLVSTPDRAAQAIVDAGLRRRPERYVPRPYGLAGAARLLLPALVRRTLTRGGAAVLTTQTGAEASPPQSS
jgi:NAD(P)-dependent dehydrogenase (short-subunit alcohol dehydrogenase family)